MANNSTNYNSTYQNNDSQQSGLMEVCSALKLNILRTLRVASYGRVEAIKNETVSVKLFPRLVNEGTSSDDRIISCNCVMVEDTTLVKEDDNYSLTKTWISLATKLSVGDIVAVVCLDRNSNVALNQAKLGVAITKLQENVNLHTEECAIIIGIIDKKED